MINCLTYCTTWNIPKIIPWIFSPQMLNFLSYHIPFSVIFIATTIILTFIATLSPFEIIFVQKTWYFLFFNKVINKGQYWIDQIIKNSLYLSLDVLIAKQVLEMLLEILAFFSTWSVDRPFFFLIIITYASDKKLQVKKLTYKIIQLVKPKTKHRPTLTSNTLMVSAAHNSWISNTTFRKAKISEETKIIE